MVELIAAFTVLQGVVLAALLALIGALIWLAARMSAQNQQVPLTACMGILAAVACVFTLYAAAVLEVGPFTVEDYKDMLGFGNDDNGGSGEQTDTTG